MEARFVLYAPAAVFVFATVYGVVHALDYSYLKVGASGFWIMAYVLPFVNVFQRLILRDKTGGLSVGDRSSRVKE